MNRLVFGHDQTIAEWASRRLDDADFQRILAAIGVVDADCTLVAASVLHHWTRYDVELSLVGNVTKDLLMATARIAFTNAHRLTLRVQRNNKKVLRAAVKYGFRLEGTTRRLYGPYKRHDAIQFGMLRDEATRFLKGENNAVSRLG